MNSKQFLESTTSGAIASVSTPVGKTQTRGKGVYPNEKGGNLLTGKKTNKKHPNSVSEAKLDEEDVIIVPGQGNRIKPGFIPRDKDRTDHEVEMAKSDLFQANKNAKKIYELIKDIPETVGIEGWVQEKIIKANDYLNTVREYLEHKELSEDTIEGKRDNFTIDDIKALERIRDLETIKTRAKELIKGFPDRRMKAEKIDYFYNRIDRLASPIQVIKLMYDLLLAGEGMKTIGSRYSTSANAYQRRFDEMTGGVIAGGGVGEGVAEGVYSDKLDAYIAKLEAKPKLTKREWMLLGTAKDYRSELARKAADGSDHRDAPSRKGVEEGYRILPPIDKERYGDRSYEGLEGPFRARNGKVYYYDPKAGMAYDPDTDIYIDYDELKMMDTEMSEGIVGKVLGGAALLAALWGIGQNQAQQVYSNSPQLQTLIKYHQMATQQGDQAKIEELERRIENHKTRLSLGKGEVMGDDDKPIVPRYESSIMKGIQNEQSNDWGSMSKSEFKRREMEHELGHETRAQKRYDQKPVLVGYYFYDIPDDDESKSLAEIWGIKKTKSGKWAMPIYNTSGRSAGFRKTKADEKFGPGKWWEPKTKSFEESKCPECGGKLVAESELNEEGNKDACYHKVKSRYKVWPSAYASGALVKCRKVGASNWGNKKK